MNYKTIIVSKDSGNCITNILFPPAGTYILRVIGSVGSKGRAMDAFQIELTSDHVHVIASQPRSVFPDSLQGLQLSSYLP